jgi:uncharacterized protein (TIGR00369 family)
MSAYTEMLDSIVARRGHKPRFLDVMRIPPIDGWEPGRVWAEWTIDEDLISPAGTLFGGYFAAVADSLLGVVMFSVLEPGEFITTSQLDIRFYRPTMAHDRVRCEVNVLNRGQRMAHCEAVFTRVSDGKPLAKANATQVIIAST